MTWQVDAVAKALASIGAPPPVQPVLCLVDGEWPIFRPPDSYRGVLLEGPGSLRRLLDRPGPLEPEEVEAVTASLAAAFRAKAAAMERPGR